MDGQRRSSAANEMTLRAHPLASADDSQNARFLLSPDFSLPHIEFRRLPNTHNTCFGLMSGDSPRVTLRMLGNTTHVYYPFVPSREIIWTAQL